MQNRFSRGLTILEVSVTVVLIGIVSGLAFNPMKNFLRDMELRNAGKNIKRLIQVAQSKAMANPNLHIGVYFDRKKTPHQAFLFQDKKKPASYVYDGPSDPLYLQPEVLKRGLVFEALSGQPDEIIFRGDGSAWKSMKICISDGVRKDTLDVLASTGRVRLGK